MLTLRSLSRFPVMARAFSTSLGLHLPIPKSFKDPIPSRLDPQPETNVSKQNKLGDLLSRVIKVTGPLTVSMYMRQCLTHPELGYYTTKDPLGASGDFITSPEISQMFGEMIGVWFFANWLSQGQPSNVNFVEFGPGRGTLMFDAMRSFNRLLSKKKFQTEKFLLNIVMIEASQVLKETQCSVLGDSDVVDATGNFWKSKHKWGGELTWVDTEKDVYEVTKQHDTNFIIAHEFFDALPINKFIKTEDGWREILVDVHPDTGEFCLVQTPNETPACSIAKLTPRYNSVKVGTVIEISPETHTYTKAIADLISRNGKSTGAALFVDYGPKFDVPGNTLRGIKDHKIVSPFQEPGEVDLSADVDFQAIADTAVATNPVDVVGPVEQGDFLEQVGISTRVKQLLKYTKTDREEEILMSGYKRLVEKDGASMGKIYKFLGLVPKGAHVPMGFES